MLTFEKIKDYFDSKYWDKYQVGMAVKYGKITAEEYKLIVEEKYED